MEADQHSLRAGQNRGRRKEGWSCEGAAIAARPLAGFLERCQTIRSAKETRTAQEAPQAEATRACQAGEITPGWCGIPKVGCCARGPRLPVHSLWVDPGFESARRPFAFWGITGLAQGLALAVSTR